MKKKLIFTLTMIFITYFNNIPATAAEACETHKNYYDTITATTSSWNTSHDYTIAYKYNPDGILVPVKSTCSIYNYIRVHVVKCGACHLEIGSYNETVQTHSKCGK